MVDRASLRQMAETMPAVLVDAATLIELLDAADRAPKAKAPRTPRQANDDDEKCARWLYGAILNTAPKFKEPNFKAWANEVRLMRERDGRTRREMCELLQWAHSIPFWRGNILSPAKLREHWDRLTIQRDAAAAPKPAAAAPWWTSEVAKLAKANEVGVGPARIGESTAAWEARIREAIDNGGKPPTPPARIRPTVEAANASEQRGMKPAGLNLKALVGPAPTPRAA
ncbi:hypothetical protein [Massilia brevitalea]|uniref:hypothetical protein n=1 Tax=Massilia brevitalea TaxID=442526 RepID=UPI002739A4C4|nr:hypothetical protein [Massilia brevitalea]